MEEMKWQLVQEKKDALNQGEFYKHVITNLKDEVYGVKDTLSQNQQQIQSLISKMHEESNKDKEEKLKAFLQVKQLQEQLLINKITESKRAEELTRALLKNQPEYNFSGIRDWADNLDRSYKSPELDKLVGAYPRRNPLSYAEQQQPTFKQSSKFLPLTCESSLPEIESRVRQQNTHALSMNPGAGEEDELQRDTIDLYHINKLNDSRLDDLALQEAHAQD